MGVVLIGNYGWHKDYLMQRQVCFERQADAKKQIPSEGERWQKSETNAAERADSRNERRRIQ